MLNFNTKKAMKKLSLIVVFSIILTGCAEQQTRIACVGDSITEGAGIILQDKYSYPAILDSLLPEKFQVLNSGRSSTTLQKKGDFSYWNTKEFYNLFAFNPDIVLIKLGTNDTKPQNWDKESFEKDYQALIDTIRTMKSSPQIILCIPVPVFATKWGINDSTLVAGVIPVIENIARKNQLKMIDLYTPLKTKHNLFPDDIHPNESGTELIAKIIADFINGKTTTVQNLN
jgi:acyl-CoA thioesterase I